MKRKRTAEGRYLWKCHRKRQELMNEDDKRLVYKVSMMENEISLSSVGSCPQADEQVEATKGVGMTSSSS